MVCASVGEHIGWENVDFMGLYSLRYILRETRMRTIYITGFSQWNLWPRTLRDKDSDGNGVRSSFVGIDYIWLNYRAESSVRGWESSWTEIVDFVFPLATLIFLSIHIFRILELRFFPHLKIWLWHLFYILHNFDADDTLFLCRSNGLGEKKFGWTLQVRYLTCVSTKIHKQLISLQFKKLNSKCTNI